MKLPVSPCPHDNLDAAGIVNGRSAVRCLACGSRFAYDRDGNLVVLFGRVTSTSGGLSLRGGALSFGGTTSPGHSVKQ